MDPQAPKPYSRLETSHKWLTVLHVTGIPKWLPGLHRGIVFRFLLNTVSRETSGAQVGPAQASSRAARTPLSLRFELPTLLAVWASLTKYRGKLTAAIQVPPPQSLPQGQATTCPHTVA